MDTIEFERRKAVALTAIRQARGTDVGEYSIDLFVAHHLEELPQAYWQEQLATATPEFDAVMGLLVCRSWGQNDLEYFDFTLPGKVTDYVVTVHFDDAGDIDDIAMES